MINLVTLARSSAFVPAVLSGLSGPAAGALRDTFWHVVDSLCVGNQRLTASPAPCSVVDSARGFALLWAGGAHYLLVPTAKIPGIESDELLAPAAPNYWAFAWQSRSFLDDTVGKAVPRSVIAMAINSAQARTQDQLHIHIGCLRRDVLAALRRFEAKAAASRSAPPWSWPAANIPWRAFQGTRSTRPIPSSWLRRARKRRAMTWRARRLRSPAQPSPTVATAFISCPGEAKAKIPPPPNISSTTSARR